MIVIYYLNAGFIETDVAYSLLRLLSKLDLRIRLFE